jgi:hypothetical protein
MTWNEADTILVDCGGEHKRVPGLCGKPYEFGAHCYVSIEIGRESGGGDGLVVVEKYLIRPSFGQWLEDCFKRSRDRRADGRSPTARKPVHGLRVFGCHPPLRERELAPRSRCPPPAAKVNATDDQGRTPRRRAGIVDRHLDN